MESWISGGRCEPADMVVSVEETGSLRSGADSKVSVASAQ